MSATPILDALPGEELIAIEPPLLQQVDAGWLHRLNPFTGRALTAAVLQREQLYRAGRLAALGQAVTQGVVKGLAVSADFTAADPLLQVSPGYGISASGEDVALGRALRANLGSLPVIDAVSGALVEPFSNYAANPANTTHVGILLLQPVTGQVSGAAFNTGTVPEIVSGNLNASCDQDSVEFAFADWQIVDGVRLVLAAWPATDSGLVLPSADPAATWRNRLAYTIFNAELALAPDDRLPWDMLGVPLALIGFDTGWKPLFLDRASVARTGGLPRSRYVLPASSGFLLAPPAVAQARLSQFINQLAASAGLTGLAQDFAFLPPCGLLPAASMDFNNHVGLWFPPNWTLTVGPVHQEEVEPAMLAGMTAQPLDVTQNESVQVLLPLPDTLYDPDILITETVDPVFQQAITSAQEDLTFVLQHRATIQEEANALSRAITGSRQTPPYQETTGLTPAEIAQLGPTLAVGAHSITAVYSGDANNAAASSAAVMQTVSNVSLSASVNPAASGVAVVLTASLVNPAATGTVQFNDGVTALAAPVAVNGGVASLPVSTLSPGTHALTAAYSGDANNPASVSPVVLETVSLSLTKIALKTSASSAASGQAVTLTATVTPNTATGNVQFLDGSTLLGTVPIAAGTAVLAVSSLAAGTHSLTTSYAGDKSNPACNSAAVKQTVAPVAAVTLSAPANPSIVGEGIAFTAVVSSRSATGSVQFNDGATPLGPPVALSAGIATLQVFETLGTLPGTHGGYVAQDYQKLVTEAGNSPYTIFVDGNGTPLSPPLPLFSKDDMDDLEWNGIQHFIDRINLKISRANDLLDLAFLTAQSDIYRFRQYILGASDATALAVSPVAAQIAGGESAAITASNLQSYLSAILPANSNSPNTPPPTTTPPPGTTKVVSLGGGLGISTGTSVLRPIASKTALVGLRPVTATVAQPAAQRNISLTSFRQLTPVNTAQFSTIAKEATVTKAGPAAGTFTATTAGTASQPASATDITAQSPLVGAQLNLRTLTIAQRMANPPSQEGLFYAVGNRAAFLNLLADLEITIDDLPILVDNPPPPATTTPAPGTTAPPAPSPTLMPLVRDIRPTQDAAHSAAVFAAVQSPNINTPGTEADEAALFSTGIHVLEQHVMLLRGVEGRIQQYVDFLTECTAALGSVQDFLPQAQTRLAQLENDLAQARQDVTFTTALLNDETARVANVNAQRAYTLQNYVPNVVYTRPRTLQTAAAVPSRQLVPGNIASPVPACLQQSVAIPPELREIVALLRDAPISWMPSIQALLNRLERPIWLQDLAADLQSRAVAQLALPLRSSSAAAEPGVYAPVISDIYSANQQTMRTFQAQRVAFQPAQLVNQSWASQIQILKGVASAGDLLYSAAVHAEIVNATSRLMQQISNVATCLYARACQTLPIDRLDWAEFLMGTGLNIPMQSLAVLPNWNTQDYVTRQQTQMLADWLFQQIDTTMPAALAFMSDVVRVVILLASDAPVDSVIAGAVTLATPPKVGGIVPLTLPSDRIARGMYVQLYSAGTLAAQAVVTDMDSSGVRATVTQVYTPGVMLQANDAAHFSALAPAAAAMRAFEK